MSSTPKTLTNDEAWKLLDQLLEGFGSQNKKNKAVRNYTMAVLMIDAGLRVGEVVKLYSSDLWFNNAPVTSVYIRTEIAKNNVSRQIPVSSRLCAAIKQMYASYWYRRHEIGSIYAFISSDQANPLTTRQVERIIRAAAMKALGRPIHPHVLRHTFASNLMRITDMRTVQELLGHKHISSTQVYTHPNEQDKVKAIACMQNGCVDTSEALNNLHRAADAPNRLDTTDAHRDMR